MATGAIGIIGIARLRDWRVVVVAGWLCALAAAFGIFINYSSTAGPPGTPPRSWPAECPLEKGPGDTLLMFAHPRCPCTRASLRELAVLMAHAPELNRIQVVFFQPRGADELWKEAHLVRQARQMTGADVILDPQGTIAAQFGVETSGHVLLYDAMNQLRFSGGITALRSHEGRNPGSDSLLALGQGESIPFAEAPVFGCPIFDRAGECCPENCEVQP